MALKIDNRITARLSNKAMFCLQAAGYIDGKKRATLIETSAGKGYSPFISKLIIDYFELGRNQDRAMVEIKSLKSQLKNLVNKRDEIEDNIQNMACKIEKIKKFVK